MKKSCEITCPADNYDSVIEVLNHFRINYEDEYSIIVPPKNVTDKKTSFKYGFIGGCVALSAILLTMYFLHWTQVVNFPLNTGGLINFDFMISLPIIFEATILITIPVLFIVFLTSDTMWKFREKKDDDKRTIYIDFIYSIDLLQTKLNEYNAEIKYVEK